MIRTPLSTVIGGAFWTPGATVIGGTSKKTFDQLIQSLFANNDQGFFYDPNDLSTMFQDAAGTVPVTAAGQPVGLMLDKSNGLTLSPELFDNETVLLQGGVTYLGDSTYRIETPSAFVSFNVQGIPLGMCLLDYTVLSSASGSVRIDAQNYAHSHHIVGLGNKKHLLRNSRGNIAFVRSAVPTDVTIRINSIRQILGNHAYQTTSASRPIFEQKPILGANFVTDSTLAEPSKWNTSVTSGVSVSGNKLIFNNVTASHPSVASPLSTKLTAGKRYLLSYIISEHVSGAVRAQIVGGATINTASFNKNGRVSLGITATAGHSFIGFQSVVAGTTLNISEVYLQEITGYLTDQNYLQFDGADDFLQTNNIDFTATDKVSLFAGVQKLSDATNYQTIVDFGVNPPVNDGSFSMVATGVSVGAGFNFESRGTARAAKKFNYSFAQGSAVICGKLDILNKILHIQINSTQGQQGLIDQGTGNYSNYPLYIGRRGGTSIPFNGRLYSLIGIGRLTTDSETIALEKAIAKNTGVTLNV